MNGQVNTEKLLRQLPVCNVKGSGFPQETSLPQIQKLPEIKLDSIERRASANEMFRPWYKEIDTLKENVEKQLGSHKKFEQWYKAEFLNKMPPGLIGNRMTVLSPSKNK